MPTFKTDERIFETSDTTGAGEYTLNGAQVGFQPFSVIGAGNLCPYIATDDVNWESGIGTYIAAPSRLQRTKILRSSNGGAAVNWGVGTKKLRCGMLADFAVPRKLVKDVAGGAGTTVLTQDEQRRHVIEFTGALTGARVVEVDATPWTWVIYNNTSGAFSLTLKVTGQTGVAIPQGKRVVVYCDEVDVRRGAATPSGNTFSEFDSGTAIVFNQTTAPTGWTKQTTHNDKALRVVSGTVGSGGATAFTTVFGAGKLTGAKTLATAEIPAHFHNIDAAAGGGATPNLPQLTSATPGNISSQNTGGGGSHDHTLSLDLQYVDVIIATKDA